MELAVTSTTMLVLAALCALLFWPAVVAAAFGWTLDGDEYVIDSGADLVIRVNTCCGDITSLLYKGVEYQGYSGKNTCVPSKNSLFRRVSTDKNAVKSSPALVRALYPSPHTARTDM